jgi:uncharacterized protein YdeI (YjbR/CyaY-like superfamily)
MAKSMGMATDASADTPTLFHSAQAFETWVKRHHASSTGLWLRIAKRGAEEASVNYPEAVEVAPCWGWIDGHKKSLDAQHFKGQDQRLTGPGSQTAPLQRVLPFNALPYSDRSRPGAVTR